MLGWGIIVFRQRDGSLSPAQSESELGARLAIWDAGIDGLDWIDDLVKAGKAIDLGGNGYPCRYTATAAYLLPYILNPPNYRQDNRVISDNDVYGGEQPPLAGTDREMASLCRPDEWLLVEAWDAS